MRPLQGGFQPPRQPAFFEYLAKRYHGSERIPITLGGNVQKSYDLEKLFKIVDVRAETDAFMEGIPSEIQAQLEMLSQDTTPDIQPGP